MENQTDTAPCRALPDSSSTQDRGTKAPSAQRTIQPELFSYRLLSPRRCGLSDVPLIGEAYRCWTQVWSETLRELDGLTHVPSDDFTRQDEVGAIFYGYECVALSCFRWVDLSNPMNQDDSYFRIWPASAREAACREGHRVCVGSHITVARAWRKTFVKDVVTALTIERLFASDYDAMVGTMRDDKGMGMLVERLGAVTLGHGRLHGVPVTLNVVYRSSARQPLAEPEEKLVRTLRKAMSQGGQP